MQSVASQDPQPSTLKPERVGSKDNETLAPLDPFVSALLSILMFPPLYLCSTLFGCGIFAFQTARLGFLSTLRGRLMYTPGLLAEERSWEPCSACFVAQSILKHPTALRFPGFGSGLGQVLFGWACPGEVASSVCKERPQFKSQI